MHRLTLPFRKNTEGYFVDTKGNILAKKVQGIIIFPGLFYFLLPNSRG